MKHSSIRELYDYWNERRGARVAPARSDIEPGAIRRLLADTFILSFDMTEGHVFRVAGTRVCAAFGHELKGKTFLDLWAAESQPMVRDLLNVVAHESLGVVASAHGKGSGGGEIELELLALPLSHRGRNDVRVLGALVPAAPPHWLGSETLGPLTLGTLRFLGSESRAETAPPIAPARPAGRIRHGFVVYDGGQI